MRMEEIREQRDCQVNQIVYINIQKKENEFIFLNNKYLLIIYISIILDVQNMVGNKIDKIFKFTSFLFELGRDR